MKGLIDDLSVDAARAKPADDQFGLPDLTDLSHLDPILVRLGRSHPSSLSVFNIHAR
jgi:hypothetical protein